MKLNEPPLVLYERLLRRLYEALDEESIKLLEPMAQAFNRMNKFEQARARQLMMAAYQARIGS